MIERAGRVGRIRPFDESGITRGAEGRLEYLSRPPSLVAALRATVDLEPQRQAIIEFGRRSLTYEELWSRSMLVAGGLHSDGVRPGDRVAIRLGNCLDWVLAFYGALMAGAIVVPINTRLTESEVAYILRDSSARYVIDPSLPLPHGRAYVWEKAEPDDHAAIFYTSGTTGRPKGAAKSHSNFGANCETCRRVMTLPRDGYRTLIAVPLFHATGCNVQLLSAMELGGTAVMLEAFDAEQFLTALASERITHLVAVPAIYTLLLRRPTFARTEVGTVQSVVYGGAATPPELIARLRAAFPVAQLANGFGLTETSSVCTLLPHSYCVARPESVGFAVPVVELDLEGIDGGVGELLVKGPNVISGYWNNAQATSEAFVDGWFHTGDLARIDEDGFVQVVDRKKDMINRGGENVYCVEVENVLMEHPGVAECAVLAVPDAVMGEKVGAVVVRRSHERLSARDLSRFAATRIADFKLPQYIVVTDRPLPRNPGGKVIKGQLRQETNWGVPLR